GTVHSSRAHLPPTIWPPPDRLARTRFRAIGVDGTRLERETHGTDLVEWFCASVRTAAAGAGRGARGWSGAIRQRARVRGGAAASRRRETVSPDRCDAHVGGVRQRNNRARRIRTLFPGRHRNYSGR